MRRLLAVVAAFAVVGCSLDKQTAPALAGPSELGLSVKVSATPDSITQDGKSQAVILVTALDAQSQPVSGLTLRAETLVAGTIQDFGSLSQKTLSTGSDGRATITYRAPAPPPPTATDDVTVEVSLIPVGSDYGNAVARNVLIHLNRPGIIQPPNGAPKPAFFFSPTAPNQNDQVLFDGSASKDDGTIVSYTWNFGDGAVETDPGPRTTHSYGLPGSYNAVLTVTDNQGLTASTDPQAVKVGASTAPVAAFTFSPTAPATGQAVNFNGSASSVAAGHSITDYDWDFGDGSGHAHGLTAQHVYTVAGTYSVTLKVSDDSGRTGATSLAVQVGSQNPTAIFTFSPTNPTLASGGVVQFTGVKSTAAPGRSIVLYQWDFGDNNSSANGVVANHTFTRVGAFTVTLVVTDNTGATGVTSASVTVAP